MAAKHAEPPTNYNGRDSVNNNRNRDDINNRSDGVDEHVAQVKVSGTNYTLI